MKIQILITALTAVMAIGSACQTPAEAKHRHNSCNTQYNNQYNTQAYKRQLWEQNQAALMRRNRNIQLAQRQAVNTRYDARYNAYNNRDGRHHNHH